MPRWSITPAKNAAASKRSASMMIVRITFCTDPPFSAPSPFREYTIIYEFAASGRTIAYSRPAARSPAGRCHAYQPGHLDGVPGWVIVKSLGGLPARLPEPSEDPQMRQDDQGHEEGRQERQRKVGQRSERTGIREEEPARGRHDGQDVEEPQRVPGVEGRPPAARMGGNGPEEEARSRRRDDDVAPAARHGERERQLAPAVEDEEPDAHEADQVQRHQRAGRHGADPRPDLRRGPPREEPGNCQPRDQDRGRDRRACKGSGGAGDERERSPDQENRIEGAGGRCRAG